MPDFKKEEERLRVSFNQMLNRPRGTLREAFERMNRQIRRPDVVLLTEQSWEDIVKETVNVSSQLASKLIDLCQEHQSSGWTKGWEFVTYLAVTGNGDLDFGREPKPKLTWDQHMELQRLAKSEGVWPSAPGPGEEYEPASGLVLIPLEEWNKVFRMREDARLEDHLLLSVQECRAWLELSKTPEVVGLARVNDAYIVFVTELTPEAVRPWHGGPVTDWLPNLRVASTVHKLYGKEPGMLFDRGPERD